MNRIKQRIATHKARKAKAIRKHQIDFSNGHWQSFRRKQELKFRRNMQWKEFNYD